MEDYVSALILQLESELKWRKTPLFSVYFGGGTPSLLQIKHFDRIFSKISPFIMHDTEITIEANPSSWSRQKASDLRRIGANRISLGIQSLNDEKLRFLSRVHDAKTALKAYESTVTAGFSNISVDFMYDTEFDEEGFISLELDNFLGLDATHISAYSLTIEDNTLFKKIGRLSRYDENAAVFIAKRLTSAGYEHYEVANFGKKRSQHNFGYWEYRPYIGVGAGAVGFDGKNRYYLAQNIEEYIKNPLQKKFEQLNPDNIKTEKILLGLRSKVGVNIELIKNKKVLFELLESGFLIQKGVKIYAKNIFLADELALRLI